MQKPVIHPELLSDIEAVMADTGLSKPDFGKFALNDPRLVYDIEGGRELRRSTESAVLAKIGELRARGTA